MIVTAAIFIFTILSISDNTSALIQLPSVGDNDIVITETAIRDITNKLFENLQLRPSKKQTTRLKQFSVIHNYLVSLTLTDYDNLKEIAKLARVDNGSDKVEQFMGVINDILNETPEENTNIGKADIDQDVIDTVDTFLNNLKFLKQSYGLNKSVKELNKELFHYLELDQDTASNSNFLPNLPFQESESDDDEYNSTVNDASDYWQPSGRRIFRGERTKIKYFPFMASVHIFGQFQCAGSIIKSDLVITASSCLQLAYNNRFFRENPKFLSVRVGSSWYEGGGEVIPVLEVYFHPRYDPKTLSDNIAIMRLHRWIRFSKRRRKVKKIRLDQYDHGLPDNTDGIAMAGWGAKSASNIVKDPWINQLSYAILDIYPLEECKDVYTSTYITKRNFCAGFMSKGGGACNRDVGGPGIVDGVLTGIISFGSPVCGAADTPTVFTKVGFYYEWIDDIMKQHVPRGYARTTPSYYATYIYERSIFTTTEEPKVAPITTTKRTQYPTVAESVEVSTDSLLSEKDKEKLFEQFLESVFQSEERQKNLKNKELLRLAQLAQMQAERQSLNGSSFVGNTQAMDINEPIVPETTPGVTQIVAKISEEENDTPIAMIPIVKEGEPPVVKNDELTDEVPSSKELERDNAQIAAAEENKNALLSVDLDKSSAVSSNGGDQSDSSEAGLSVASFEDLTLRHANRTDKIFDIPQEKLYDLISDRLGRLEATINQTSKEEEKKPAVNIKNSSVVPRL